MALTLTVTTPLTDDDRRVLGALLVGADPRSFLNQAMTETSAAAHAAAAPAPAPETASETEPDAGAPESGEGLDADGLPWDEAIHSSNRKKTAAGVWMRRRGVQDAVFDARVAELRAAMAEDATEATGAEVFNQQVNAAAQTLATPPAPPAPAAESPQPPAPPAAAPTPPAPAPAATEGNEWEGQPGFLKIMKMVTAKKLPAERLNALLVDVGLAPTTTSLLKADAATRETFAALLEGAE